MLEALVHEVAGFLLLALPALFSIINPLGGAFLFLAATESCSPAVRSRLARRIGIYSFFTLVISMLVGGVVLQVFGISVPVLRVAGGILIAVSALRLLDAGDTAERETVVEEAGARAADQMAFYPLTMPMTTGPGTISVAIALGTTGKADARPLAFGLEVVLASGLICILIYMLYRASSSVARAVGPTATAIIARLSAFLLFCIGIQVLWTGLAELLGSLS